MTEKQYACLSDGCKQIFGKWGDVRKHMNSKQCLHQYNGPNKPNLKDSALKAKEIIANDPGMAAALVAETALPKPWENVSADDLVEVIRSYYDRTDLSPATKRKHVLGNAIRPRYGDVPFGKFGHGTLELFLEEHGFEEKGHMERLKRQGAFSRNRKTDKHNKTNKK